jgi:molecular chaperone Hsp33
MSEDGGIFCAAIENKDVVEYIKKIWKPSAAGLIALGRLAAGTSLVGSLLKNDGERLTVRFSGKGVGGNLMAVSDQYGNVKVRADNPSAVPEHPLSVAEFVGKDGEMSVIHDLGLARRGELPYTTSLPIFTGEIAQDFTQYFGISEQIPTVCSLGVLLDEDKDGELIVKAAGGFFLQCLPPVTQDHLNYVMTNIKKSGRVTEMLARGDSAEKIALAMLDGLNPSVLDTFPNGLRCDCDRNKVLDMLATLPKAELRKMAEQDNDKTEIKCDFCQKKYILKKDEINRLLIEIK